MRKCRRILSTHESAKSFLRLSATNLVVCNFWPTSASLYDLRSVLTVSLAESVIFLEYLVVELLSQPTTSLEAQLHVPLSKSDFKYNLLFC